MVKSIVKSNMNLPADIVGAWTVILEGAPRPVFVIHTRTGKWGANALTIADKTAAIDAAQAAHNADPRPETSEGLSDAAAAFYGVYDEPEHIY